MSKKLIIEVTQTMQKYAVLDKNETVSLDLFFLNEPMVGDIYLGRVEKYNHTMEAAFVDIGSEMIFLPSKRVLIEGSQLLVQIVRTADKSKRARATADVTIGGTYVVALLGEEGIRVSKKTRENPDVISLVQSLESQVYPFGLLLRSAATLETRDQVQTEILQIQALVSGFTNSIGRKYRQFHAIDHIKNLLLMHQISQIQCNDSDYVMEMKKEKIHHAVELIYHEIRLFDYHHIDLEAYLMPEHCFQNFKLTVHHLEALCVIDVDASFQKRTKLKHQQIQAINESALEEILRIICEQRIAGIVIIDFITMNAAQTSAFYEHVQGRLRKLREDTGLNVRVHMSGGIVQFVIEKARGSIVAAISNYCPSCNGSGLVMNSGIMIDAFEIELAAWLKNRLDRSIEVLFPRTMDSECVRSMHEIAHKYDVQLKTQPYDGTKIKIQ